MSRSIRLVLLGLWLGMTTFFSFIIAPAAFSALPTRALAGSMVSVVLSRVEIIGIALGIVLLILLFFSRDRSGKGFLFESIALGAMTLSTAGSYFFVSKRLHQIRLKYGSDLASLASTDPDRVAFDQLHQLSVALTSFVMLASLVLIVYLVWLVRKNSSLKPNA